MTDEKSVSDKELEDKDKDELILAKEWMDEAKACTPESLSAFLKKLSDHDHGYGTICRAIAAAGVAAMHSIDRSPNGGITGFQAGCVIWDVISGWGSFEDGPKKMVQYAKMLYPQYQSSFDKTISEETWNWLQEEAKKKIGQIAHVDVLSHWQSIVDGVVPFGYTVVQD